MNKTAYITPVMQITHICATNIIATSNPKVSVDPDDNVDASDIDVKGHSTNVWDIDWSK